MDAREKKLLVLDVKGFLVDTYYAGDPLPSREHDRKVNRFLVYKRPLCDEFIHFCLENFVVGVWSAAYERNVHALVDYIFEGSKEKLAFIWCQGHCTDIGFKHPDNNNKPIFLKELWRFWESQKDKSFNPSNTILIDDSPYKALNNPPHTAIFPKPYNALDVADNCLGELRTYLNGVLESLDVQAYLRTHPFGEPSISIDDPQWSSVFQFVMLKNKENGYIPHEWLGVRSITLLEYEGEQEQEQDVELADEEQKDEQDVELADDKEQKGEQDVKLPDNEKQKDEQDDGERNHNKQGHEEQYHGVLDNEVQIKDSLAASKYGSAKDEITLPHRSGHRICLDYAWKGTDDPAGLKFPSLCNSDGDLGQNLRSESDGTVSMAGHERLNRSNQLTTLDTHPMTPGFKVANSSIVRLFDDSYPFLCQAGLNVCE